MVAITQATTKQQRQALLGLVLVAMAPTVSVITGFGLKAGLVAAIVFILTKLWVFGLPAYWYLKIEANLEETFKEKFLEEIKS